MAVAAAVVPLVGVLKGGWSLREVVVLYWAENLVIGLLHFVRIITVSPPGARVADHLGKLFMAGFFAVHYGGFCLAHGFFIFALTTGVEHGHPVPQNKLLPSPGEFPVAFWIALGFLALNHLWNLIERWFLGGRWRTADPKKLMAEPYKHIVVLHLGIILGAFIATAFRKPVGILVLIVLGKLVLDLRDDQFPDSAGASS